MTEGVFRTTVISIAGALGLALFFFRFCGSEAVPPLPPAPETTLEEAKQLALNIGERSDVYSQQLLEDSRRFDVSEAATIESMSQVFKHRADRTPRTLKNGGSATVLGLRMSLSTRDIELGSGRRARQMELVIDNQSGKHLAYRIVTRPSKGTRTCSNKETRIHNAIVLAPGEIARRSECLYKSGWKLEIGKVETVEVPLLSYFYLSSMPPSQLGLDTRVSEGHRGPTGVQTCQTVLPARVQRSMERGEVLWRDLVDFFARHSCEKYRFPHDYRAFDKPGASKLPAPGSVR